MAQEKTLLVSSRDALPLVGVLMQNAYVLQGGGVVAHPLDESSCLPAPGVAALPLHPLAPALAQEPGPPGRLQQCRRYQRPWSLWHLSGGWLPPPTHPKGAEQVTHRSRLHPRVFVSLGRHRCRSRPAGQGRAGQLWMPRGSSSLQAPLFPTERGAGKGMRKARLILRRFFRGGSLSPCTQWGM